MKKMHVVLGSHGNWYINIARCDGGTELFGSFDCSEAAQEWIERRPFNIREAFAQAFHEDQGNIYRRTFQLMYKRLPSHDEQEMIKRRCRWYEAGLAKRATR